MNDFLSPDEIEALFNRASEGNLPMEVEREVSGGGKRTRWLRTVDFSRPSKFSTDQERRLRRLLTNVCPVAGQRVMAEHRLPLELEIIDVQQLTWADAFKQLPDGSGHATLKTAPYDGSMLLSFELPLLIAVVEGLTGGDPTSPPPERELTDIDLLLTRRLLRTIVEALSGAWFDQAEMTLDLTELTANPEAVQIAHGREPTLAMTLAVQLHGLTRTASLLVPYAAIEPAASAFSQRDEDLSAHDERSAAAMRSGVERVDITLRAEVAGTTLSLQDVLALQPGDTIALDADGSGEVTVFADRTAIHRARPGSREHRRAVQIVGPVTTEASS